MTWGQRLTGFGGDWREQGGSDCEGLAVRVAEVTVGMAVVWGQ